MLVHGFIDGSRVNGPGLRAVIHLQGCGLSCDGCFNPGAQPFTGEDRDSREVAGWVIRANRISALDGVTFSGGEPMQQGPELLALIESLHRHLPGLSFGMYSGYSLRELECGRYWTRPEISEGARRELWVRVSSYLDFAVLGRYVATRPSALPLRSSANQELVLFTGRYREQDFEPKEVEIHIEAQGLVQVTGFPVKGLPV
jgi:anaerobic ribonucleoside-triphosphate reductase activating protein